MHAQSHELGAGEQEAAIADRGGHKQTLPALLWSLIWILDRTCVPASQFQSWQCQIRRTGRKG